MALYTDDHIKLGRYLGLSIGNGPDMMAKIMQDNGQDLHRPMYLALTQEEWK